MFYSIVKLLLAIARIQLLVLLMWNAFRSLLLWYVWKWLRGMFLLWSVVLQTLVLMLLFLESTFILCIKPLDVSLECIWLQANHQITTKLQRRLYSHATDVEIRPLNEEKAVQAAVDLIGELFVFTVIFSSSYSFVEFIQDIFSPFTYLVDLSIQPHYVHM